MDDCNLMYAEYYSNTILKYTNQTVTIMFNVKYECSDPVSPELISEFEKKRGITLPSNYVFILTNCNEFFLADDQFGAILDDEGEEITGLEEPMLSLEDFERANFDLSDQMKEYYNFSNEDFYIIAGLHFNCYLLIGCNAENWDKIFRANPQEGEIVELCDNFVDFVNEVLEMVD